MREANGVAREVVDASVQVHRALGPTVEDQLLIEVKALDALTPAHRRQTLTYLKLSGYRLALLLNFGAPLMRDGIHRFAN